MLKKKKVVDCFEDPSQHPQELEFPLRHIAVPITLVVVCMLDCADDLQSHINMICNQECDPWHSKTVEGFSELQGKEGECHQKVAHMAAYRMLFVPTRPSLESKAWTQ